MAQIDRVVDLVELREREEVFADRREAGRVLAAMLEEFRDTQALVVGLPAGGIPVAVEIARRLRLPLEIAAVSKITLPWNTESGYGAVSFEGTVLLNEAMLPYLNLPPEQIEKGIEQTRTKVRTRTERLRGARPFPSLKGKTVIVVDDGLASGITMRVALISLRKLGAEHLIVAVPTGHRSSVAAVSADADRIYCANVRGGMTFAVASAYRRWHDVSDAEALAILAELPPPD